MNIQNDYILALIQKIIAMINAMIGNKTYLSDQEQGQQIDQFLDELTELDEIFFVPTSAVFPFLASLINGGLDENKKAIICVLLAKKDLKMYEKTIFEILGKIDVTVLNPEIRELLLKTIGIAEMNNYLGDSK